MHKNTDRTALSGRALRTALPGLLVLLVVAGLSAALPAGAQAQNVTVTMSGSDGDADGNAVEGASNNTGYRTITIALGRTLTGSETVTVPLTVVGATVTTDYTFGLQPPSQTGVSLTTTGGTHTAQNPAVVFAAGAASATLRLTPVDNDDRTQPYVVIDYGTGARVPSVSGVTLGDVTGGPIGIVLVDDETGDIEVPSSWALAPSGLAVGDDFRLLFRTSTGRDATSSDIAQYDAFVRGVLAGGGHADIKPYAGFFKVFGGTRSTSGSTGTAARVHNGMATAHTGHLQSGPWTDGSTRATVGNAAGVPTYWLNGAILANNYADLCDINWSGGSGVTTGWDTDDPRNEDGTRNIPTGAISDYAPYETWTGSGNTCEAYDHPLGNSTVSRSSADSGGGQTLLHSSAAANTGTHPFYGYSPVFKLVAGAPSEVTVAPDWALIPSGITAGDSFRLLFVTSTQRVASATDIATYNTFVQNRAAAGHMAIRSHSAEFRVVGSTSSVDARDNSATTGSGVPIYWLGGSNSNKVADDYADFYDGNWDSYVNTNENGAGSGNATVWTGSNDNGTKDSSNYLGATNVQYGQLFLASSNVPFTRATSGNSNSRHLYGLSPVYTVVAASSECAAQDGIFSETSIRILETGETTYCVRLTTAPSGGDTTVTIGRIGGGATASPTSLTFTSSNYQTPQQVTVTGVDEPGSHRNRTTRLSHTAAGGGPSQNLGDVQVEVDDAPELEAFWHIQGNARIRRPHTVTSTPGLTPWQNAAPGYELAYVLRLSNRPEPGGTVTVTATVPSDKRNYVGLSLTGPSVPLDGQAYHDWATNLPGTVDVEFKDRSPGAGTGCSNWLGLEDHEYLDSRGYRRTVSGGGKSESYDGTADTPWECWRMIYVVRKPASRNIDDTCADITHTATGGGVRKVTVDTVRAHIINPSRNRRGSRGQASQCRNLTGNTLPAQAAPAEAAPAPTEAVANVYVAAVDDASASVTWDAVPHATSYDVSWSAESSDSLNASAGSLPGVTGTSTTIRHDASVPMTLTVTVTPEYVDENGQTQQLDALAGTATLAVGPTDGLIVSGDGTNGGGDGDAVQAGEDETPGAAAVVLPVAHWRLDGDALDWAGSSHGTVGGGAAFEANDDGSGVGSHALVLDGSDDYMDLASHVSNFPLGDAARTVTGWFKADAGNQRQTFFTYGPNVAGQRFSIAADRTQVLVGVSGHAWGVNGLDLSDGWHHVAVTYAGGDSDSISIYLDGALQAASTLVGAPQALDTRTGPAATGRNAGGTEHYAGSIDDVRIYAAALNAEQVLALFNEHPQTPPPATTAVTASASPALAEGNLDGASVELTLDAGAFAATVGTSDVTASGVSGVSVSSATRNSDTQATATLAFDGTDFDADATLTLAVSATALAHSDTDLSATLPVAAVDEPPPPPPAVSIPAPVAHWRFDGDADDSAGSSNGSAMNGASFTTAPSVGSHALSLDGSDDHVDLASHVSNFPLGNSARSVTGWFRADAGNQRQTFFTYGPNVEGKRLSIAADRTQALVAVSGHAWGVNNLSLADGWHHIAVTFAGGRSDDFSIYLNGALQSASTLGGVRRQVDTRTGTAAIGQSVGGNAHYSGDIDDVRLYDYALSAEQVQAIAGRQETASAQDGVQATAATPGGLLPAPLALPRVSVGTDGTGAGGFSTDDASLVSGTGLVHALESGGTPESDNPHNRSILPSDPRAPSLATTASSQTHAPLVPSSSNPMREGLVQIVNPSTQAGEVQIVAIDDAGWRSAPVTLAIAAGGSAQFTSRDLEQGNAAMGLIGSTGPGTGDWRLEMSSGLDVEVLPYVRTTDGTLSAMGDIAPVTDNIHRVALFNPADSPDAASKLRLTNRGAQALRATITGIDDTGASPGGMVSVEIASDESVLLTAAELEAGGSNLLGALGDGEGQWRLDIASDGDLAVMNLAETSDGNLTNLSNATATTVPARKAHVVDRFPSSSDISNEQGVVRIVNSSESPALIRIEPNDSTGWRYAPLTLTLGANEAANLGTWDLELGNATKGLVGNAGPGTGSAWRLAISSDGDIEVLSYTRAPNGLLKVPPADTADHDAAR